MGISTFTSKEFIFLQGIQDLQRNGVFFLWQWGHQWHGNPWSMESMGDFFMAIHQCHGWWRQDIWPNYNDLTGLPHWKSWLIRGIIPKWPFFRWVNYYNLPRHMQWMMVFPWRFSMAIYKGVPFWGDTGSRCSNVGECNVFLTNRTGDV